MPHCKTTTFNKGFACAKKGVLGHPTLVFLKEYAHPALAPAGLQTVVFVNARGALLGPTGASCAPEGINKNENADAQSIKNLKGPL